MLDEQISAEGSESSLDTAVPQETVVQNDTSVSETTEASTTSAAEVDETQETNEFLLESELDEFESELSKALEATDEEKDPAWYRNALKQYERHLKTTRESAAPFKDLQGVVPQERLPDTVEMLRSLENYRMNGEGVPAPDVAKFTELFEKNYQDLAPALVMELGKRQVPGSNLNYFATALQQQYGISPEQIAQVKAYLDNDEVPDIPSQFMDAFRTLTPKLKEELPFMDEEVKLEVLTRAQADLDRTKKDTEYKTERQRVFTQEVEQAAEKRYLQGAGNAMDALAKTLEKATFSSDPEVNSLIVEENLHLILNALNPYAAGYDRARATVAKIGVQLDETRVNGILDTLAEESRNIEYFNRINQPDKVKLSEAKYARSLQELIAQGHKVAGQLLKVRGQGLQASATQQSNLLQRTEGRPVINGSALVSGDTNDWLKSLPPVGTPEYHAAVAQLATNSG